MMMMTWRRCRRRQKQRLDVAIMQSFFPFLASSCIRGVSRAAGRFPLFMDTKLSLSLPPVVCVCIRLASLVFIIIFPSFSFHSSFFCTILLFKTTYGAATADASPIHSSFCLTDPVVENTETKHAHIHIYTRAILPFSFPLSLWSIQLQKTHKDKTTTQNKKKKSRLSTM